MSYILQINQVPFDSLVAAAGFVREKHHLEQTLIVSDLFEQEFNIKIHNTNGILNFDDDIEFDSEAAYVFFLLRWS